MQSEMSSVHMLQDLLSCDACYCPNCILVTKESSYRKLGERGKEGFRDCADDL